jgi:hypothetical protein
MLLKISPAWVRRHAARMCARATSTIRRARSAQLILRSMVITACAASSARIFGSGSLSLRVAALSIAAASSAVERGATIDDGPAVEGGAVVGGLVVHAVAKSSSAHPRPLITAPCATAA